MREHRHSGFTLLELILALVIILAITAIALPNLFDFLADRQLVRGGDSVRIALVEARLEAMRTGRAQMFRAELGGSNFRVEPYYDPNDTTEAADMMGQGMSAAAGGPALLATPPPTATDNATVGEQPTDMLTVTVGEELLPRDILFEDVQVQATARAATMQQSASAIAGSGWSSPIMFYPDGTTSNAIVTVMHEKFGRVHIKIRGLTGDTDISQVVR